LIEFHTSLTC